VAYLTAISSSDKTAPDYSDLSEQLFARIRKGPVTYRLLPSRTS